MAFRYITILKINNLQLTVKNSK